MKKNLSKNWPPKVDSPLQQRGDPLRVAASFHIEIVLRRCKTDQVLGMGLLAVCAAVYAEEAPSVRVTDEKFGGLLDPEYRDDAHGLRICPPRIPSRKSNR